MKCYYLRTPFSDVTAATGGSEQSKMKGFTILDLIKSIQTCWEEDNLSSVIGILEKLIPIFMDDLEEFRKEGRCVEIARELEFSKNIFKKF